MKIPPPGFTPVITASESKKDDDRISADKQGDSLVKVRGCGATGGRPRRRNRTGASRRPQDPEVLYPASPYRWGYMFHGPPDNGKTSLSLPLAGVSGADSHVLKMQSVSGDTLLEELFQELPPYCIVLLEGIDAVGMKPQEARPRRHHARVHIAGPAKRPQRRGVPGGPDTSDNVQPAGKDRQALLRPGRIDLKMYLGHVEASGAEQMFRRVFEPDPLEHPDVGDDTRQFLEREELDNAASKFAVQTSDRAATPAHLQEFYSTITIPPRGRSVKSWNGSPSRPVRKVGNSRETGPEVELGNEEGGG
ncbi:hypothetical protein DL770_001893 [Monosporascus sp. CRB-9-2]|nr:hypothetical protein DL770_001893 [Monosporascus sp. CRB-9-2]